MKTIKTGTVFLAVVVLAILTFHRWLDVTMEEEYSEWAPSYSVAESKEKGTLVRPLKIVPETVSYMGISATFEEAWLERRSKIDYTSLFVKHRVLLDGYFVCFTITGGLLPSSEHMFVIEDEGGSFGQRVKPQHNVFYEYFETEPKGEIRMTFTDTFRPPRAKNIRILPAGGLVKKKEAILSDRAQIESKEVEPR